MKNSLPIVFILFLAVTFWSCEQPESPNFQVNNQFEIPLTMEKKYPFLGTEKALFDTTSDDYIDLFQTGENDLVRLFKEEEVDFGDLNDAIPEVDAAKSTVNSEVGQIELSNFSSSSPIGTADFNEITGESGSPNDDDPINPSGSNPPVVEIPLTTDYFESAIIDGEGYIDIVVTNDLGFNIDRLEVALYSNGTEDSNGDLTSQGTMVDDGEISPLSHGDTETLTLTIPDDTDLGTVLNLEVQAFWSDDEMVADAGDLLIESAEGRELTASEVTAAVESQDFSSSGISTIDESSFEFRDSEDFIELSEGSEQSNANLMTIDIQNSIDLEVEDLTLVFPDIKPKSDLNTNLEVPISNVPSSSDSGQLTHTVDLSEHRIYAENGEINYTIDALTEDTQEGDGSKRTVASSDDLTADIDLNNLQTKRADGYVVPKQILLNEDNTNDFEENIDVFNDDEADITQIGGLSQISDRISNLVFENPILNILYDANLGVPTTIYAVIAGTDEKGNTEFLTGLDGTDHQVQSGEIPSQLEVDGQPADENQVIKFDIAPVDDPDPEAGVPGSNEFNADNSNSSEFFSNLPSNIRFVGVAEINEKEEPGIIVEPVIFEPSFGVEIPFSLSADNATYQDTVDADFSDLPKEDKDTKLSEATITINYTNGLPLDLTLNVIMLDANGDEVATKSDISINGASTDENGFVNQESQSEHGMSFSESEMNDLHRTRSMVMDININTPEQQGVSIRGDDAVTFNVKVKAGITSTIN